MLGAPELDAALQWGLTRAEQQNPLPSSVAHGALDAAQNMAGFLGSEHTVLAHAQLFIHHNSQVLLHRAALNEFSQTGLMSGIPLTLQHHVLALVEPH